MLEIMTDEKDDEMNRLRAEYIAEFNRLAKKHHLKTRLKEDSDGEVVCGSQEQFDNHTFQIRLTPLKKIDASDLKVLTEMLKFELE